MIIYHKPFDDYFSVRMKTLCSFINAVSSHLLLFSAVVVRGENNRLLCLCCSVFYKVGLLSVAIAMYRWPVMCVQPAFSCVTLTVFCFLEGDVICHTIINNLEPTARRWTQACIQGRFMDENTMCAWSQLYLIFYFLNCLWKMFIKYLCYSDKKRPF